MYMQRGGEVFISPYTHQLSNERVNICICLERRSKIFVMLPDCEWVEFSEATPTETVVPAPGI